MGCCGRNLYKYDMKKRSRLDRHVQRPWTKVNGLLMSTVQKAKTGRSKGSPDVSSGLYSEDRPVFAYLILGIVQTIFYPWRSRLVVCLKCNLMSVNITFNVWIRSMMTPWDTKSEVWSMTTWTKWKARGSIITRIDQKWWNWKVLYFESFGPFSSVKTITSVEKTV